MRTLPLFLFLIFSLSTQSEAFTSDEEQLRQQFEDFRKQRDAAGDHRPLDDNGALAEAYLVYGRKALEQGAVDAAIDYIKSGQMLFPDDGRFSLMLGISYFQKSENSIAEMYLLDARRQVPDSDEPLYLLSKLYYQLGQLADAERLLLEIQERHPDDPKIKDQLAKLRLELTVEEKMEWDVDSIFTVRFDGAFHADLAELTLEVLQDAYSEQGALLDHYPQRRIQVILYKRKDYDLATGSPPWSAGRFDGKIRIPINPKMSKTIHFRSVLHHEYNHFLAQQLSLGRAPAWFYEGLAMAAESMVFERSIVHLNLAVTEKRLMRFSELQRSFKDLNQQQVMLAYEQSYSFVNYLLQQFGWHTMKDLLRAFSRGLSVEEAFYSVFNDFGLDYETLQGEWESDL